MSAGNADDPPGFGNPPVAYRFQPGKSGNPRGRPKGAKNMSTILKKELNARVKGTLNGRRTSISKLEYIAKQLVDKAMLADHRSIQQLMTIQPTMFGVGHTDPVQDTPLSDAEVALLEALRRRIPESDEEAGHVSDPTALSDIEEPDDDA